MTDITFYFIFAVASMAVVALASWMDRRANRKRLQNDR